MNPRLQRIDLGSSQNNKSDGLSVRYKVVETSSVTDEQIESILNEWTSKGYEFESIQFVVHVSSKRPTMAFLFFTHLQ